MSLQVFVLAGRPALTRSISCPTRDRPNAVANMREYSQSGVCISLEDSQEWGLHDHSPSRSDTSDAEESDTSSSSKTLSEDEVSAFSELQLPPEGDMEQVDGTDGRTEAESTDLQAEPAPDAQGTGMGSELAPDVDIYHVRFCGIISSSPPDEDTPDHHQVSEDIDSLTLQPQADFFNVKFSGMHMFN